MKCPRCPYENPPGSTFCLGCGTRLGVACGGCGSDLPAGSRSCNTCGTPVRGESAVEARFTSPQSYTPNYLAEKILTSRTALEGERCAAPGFLDTEQAGIVSVSVVASGSRRRETAI
jgi:hypothetical protein